MEFALRTAENSEARQRHAAVFVKGNRVLAVGININKNHPDVLDESVVRKKASVHAEVRAGSRLSDARGVTVYVARVMKDGSPGLSKPCTNCADYLKSIGVKRVVHT